MISKYKKVKGSGRLIIFLFHGIFSSAGFYIPYLAYLRFFGDIYLFNIDYAYLLRSKKPVCFDGLLSDFDASIFPKPDLIVLHSLSLIFLKSLPYDDAKIHLVCPPIFCDFSKNKFLNALDTAASVDLDLLDKAIDVTGEFGKLFHIASNISLFIPEFDDVFQYKIPSGLLVNYFHGNHFDLSDYFKRYWLC